MKKLPRRFVSIVGIISAVTAMAPAALAAIATGAPSGLRATGACARVDVAWTAPQDALGVTGYRIYRRGADGSSTEFTPASPNTTYSDAEVTNGVAYTYEVSAIGLTGESARSGPAIATPGLPSKPQNLQATGRATGPGRGQATIVWEPPATTCGSTVTGYRVYKNNTGNLIAEVPGDSPIFTDRKADRWQIYSVTAITAFGESEHAPIEVNLERCSPVC